MHSIPTPALRLVRAAAFALAIAAVVCGSAAIGTVPAQAADTDGIAAAPASVTGADGRTRFSYQVGPGQHLDDHYLVSNSGTTPQSVTVLATDAFNTPDGSYGLLDSDATPVDSGSWVRFGGAKTAKVELAPGASTLVPFSIDVPANASPGDHAGGLVVSALSPTGQILVDRRIATRLYVRVPGDIRAALTVSSVAAGYGYALTPLAGETTLHLTVRNTGNVALGGLATVGVRTWFGFGIASTVRPQIDELLPGNVRRLTVVVPGIPALGYLNPYVTIAPTISPDAIQPPKLITTTRDTTLWVVPVWPLVVLGLVALVIVIVRIRRRIDARRAAVWMAHVEAETRRESSRELAHATTAAPAPTEER